MITKPSQSHSFTRIDYTQLNSRQRENYNYQKVAGVLADYGFVVHRLSDDWNGADFLAQHIDRSTILHVQLKSRFTIAKKYLRKNLYVCFPAEEQWYFYPHDELVKWAQLHTRICTTHTWTSNGIYSVPKLGPDITGRLKRYSLD